jgi:hypothetical protein
MEAEAGMGSNLPDMLASMPNRGTDTPASDEVRRTGLQPQVDAEEIHTKEKDEQDKILAIDGSIKRFDSEMPDGSDSDTPKVNKFKEIWNNLKEKWDEIKMDDGSEEDNIGGGLSGNVGDQKYLKTMHQYPNMMPPNDQSS